MERGDRMIPNHLQGLFLPQNKRQRVSGTAKGLLTCCTNQFQVFFSGALKIGIWGKPRLQCDRNGLAVLCRCSTCKRDIVAFDSRKHGYDACIGALNSEAHEHEFQPFLCSKCQGDTFRVELSFEYLPESELEIEEFDELSEAFTWVWASVTCTSCGMHYRKILDLETG